MMEPLWVGKSIGIILFVRISFTPKTLKDDANKSIEMNHEDCYNASSAG